MGFTQNGPVCLGSKFIASFLRLQDHKVISLAIDGAQGQPVSIIRQINDAAKRIIGQGSIDVFHGIRSCRPLTWVLFGSSIVYGNTSRMLVVGGFSHDQTPAQSVKVHGGSLCRLKGDCIDKDPFVRESRAVQSRLEVKNIYPCSFTRFGRVSEDGDEKAVPRHGNLGSINSPSGGGIAVRGQLDSVPKLSPVESFHRVQKVNINMVALVEHDTTSVFGKIHCLIVMCVLSVLRRRKLETGFVEPLSRYVGIRITRCIPV
mmetsp:Transcript_5172/g.10199  ORF Transcript_5172/g.10199 Transcript_5172/m.10199 type:complete len:260 (+) Transcript_5172:628-1407(+)